MKIDIEELPIQRFYFSVTDMIFDLCHNKNEKGNEFYFSLYTSIKPYYEESLALLRAEKKLRESIQKQEEEYLDRRSKIAEVTKNLIEEDDDEEILAYRYSQLLQEKLFFYDKNELEKNLFVLGTIVQFLSLLESTLHSFYKKIICIDTNLPNVQDVCRRDKGIIKYLKYFEKALNPHSKAVLIDTSLFQSLHQWIKIRNNIVHNNNEITEELNNIIKQRKLNIRSLREKYIFDEKNIRDLADVCGEILDLLIERIIRPYFYNCLELVIE